MGVQPKKATADILAPIYSTDKELYCLFLSLHTSGSPEGRIFKRQLVQVSA